MATTPFEIGQGATLPAYPLTLLDAVGSPIPLTNATSVALLMRHRNTWAVLDLPLVVVSAVGGTVRLDWDEADTAIPGYYDAYAWITWSSGDTQRVPSGDPLVIVVTPAIGP